MVASPLKVAVLAAICVVLVVLSSSPAAVAQPQYCYTGLELCRYCGDDYACLDDCCNAP